MKTRNKLFLGMVLFSVQCMTSQVVIDTVQVKEALCATSIETLARYNYFPNLQAYFDTKKQVYIYSVNGEWVSTSTIAANYRGYSVRNGFHVPVPNYTGEVPYTLLAQHKLQWPADYSSKRRVKVVVALN